MDKGYRRLHGRRYPYDFFKELIVRWFQYGVFCPLFRLHGVREPGNGLDGAQASGGSNEVWSFGEKAYKIIVHLMGVRERLTPYLMVQNQFAHKMGLPPMRPLFIDFPGDEGVAAIDDQFMLGPDLMIAPILEEGKAKREVHLPSGTDWKDGWTGAVLSGDQMIVAEAPLEKVPVYWRASSPFDMQF